MKARRRRLVSQRVGSEQQLGRVRECSAVQSRPPKILRSHPPTTQLTTAHSSKAHTHIITHNCTPSSSPHTPHTLTQAGVPPRGLVCALEVCAGVQYVVVQLLHLLIQVLVRGGAVAEEQRGVCRCAGMSVHTGTGGVRLRGSGRVGKDVVGRGCEGGGHEGVKGMGRWVEAEESGVDARSVCVCM